MEEQVANVKKYIISLLTASPLAMTMVQLDIEYRETIGEPIPYEKLGYSSLEHLLKSIPDTVRVHGSGPMAEILSVPSEKSSHVMELVSAQKKPTPKNRVPYYGNKIAVIAPMVRHEPRVEPHTQNRTRRIFNRRSNNGLTTPNHGWHTGFNNPNYRMMVYFPTMVPRYGFGPQGPGPMCQPAVRPPPGFGPQGPGPMRQPAVRPPPGFVPNPQEMFNMAEARYNCLSRGHIE